MQFFPHFMQTKGAVTRYQYVNINLITDNIMSNITRTCDRLVGHNSMAV